MTRFTDRSFAFLRPGSVLVLIGFWLSLVLGGPALAQETQDQSTDRSQDQNQNQTETQPKEAPTLPRKSQDSKSQQSKTSENSDQSGESKHADQQAQSEPAPTAKKPDQANVVQQPAKPADASVVGWLELSEPLRDGPVPYSWVSSQDAGPSLQSVLNQIQTVAQGDQYKGLVIYFDSPQLSMTQTGRIAQAVKEARDNGKKVLAFAESYGLREYLIGCASDMILLQHKGGVEVNGLQVEELYLGGMLEKIGVQADLVQIGKYKGAADPLARRSPSQAWNKNMDRVMDSLYAQVVDQIGQGRGMNKAEVEQLLAHAWAMSDQQLVKNNVVDRLTNRDLVNVTEIEFGDQFTWDQSMGQSNASGNNGPPSNPFALFQTLFQSRQTTPTRPTIAVVHATGPIHSGKSSTGGAFASESIGSKTLVKLLGRVRSNKNVKGLVLRVDSPGGSALASEVMWQAIRQVGQKKPVFASVGDIAASGGYYLVCAADEIYISPRSLIGSIGVVGGKIVLGDLYDMAGIGVKRRARGPNADMFNSVEPFTKTQRKQLRESMKLVYEQFTDRVALGRGNRIKDISKVAKGRIYTGKTSVDNGLADQLGGVDAAVTDMAKQLDLKPGQYDVWHLPRPMSFQQFLSDAFTAASPVGGASMQSPLTNPHAWQTKSAPAFAVARQLLGPRAWHQIRQTLSGLMMFRDESVLAIMPHTIVIK